MINQFYPEYKKKVLKDQLDFIKSKKDNIFTKYEPLKIKIEEINIHDYETIETVLKHDSKKLETTMKDILKIVNLEEYEAYKEFLRNDSFRKTYSIHKLAKVNMDVIIQKLKK